MVDVVGVDATAREVSVTNVNCELTDGVDVSECDVETLVNVSVDVIDGKLITVPLEVELAVAVLVKLPLVMVVLFPEMVEVNDMV